MPLVIEAKAYGDLPIKPAVYALYGGTGKTRYIAYVGITRSLRQRVKQHLVDRDGSVTGGTSAAGLNPANITEVRWWEHRSLRKPEARQAAELIAFTVLDPVLRSRGRVSAAARAQAENFEFGDQIRTLLAGESSGRMVVPTMELLVNRIDALEHQIAAMERALASTRHP